MKQKYCIKVKVYVLYLPLYLMKGPQSSSSVKTSMQNMFYVFAEHKPLWKMYHLVLV